MNYIISTSVQDALKNLSSADGSAMILAGGTDLILDIEAGKKSAQTLIDVTRIPAMRQITVEDSWIFIGGAVTLTEIARSPIVKKYYPSLCRGCQTVGSLQIRNAATLSGNVISAQPAADGAMALAPLKPLFIIESADGTRTLQMEEMYAGFGKSAIDSSKEILTQIRIPIPAPDEAASFVRLELRKSLSLPMLNAAARIRMEQGIISDVHITMGPVGVGPKRAREAEQFLIGKPLTLETATEAGKLSLLDAAPRSNPLRGSREYRESTLPVLIKRALMDIKNQFEC